MVKRILVLGGILLLLAASNSYAYRPLATEDAGVAGKGVAQTEVSWDTVKWKNGDKEDLFLLVPIYGLTENIELSVEIPYMFHKPEAGSAESGIGDVNLVIKALFVEEKDVMPAFTVKGVVKMDNGDYDKGFGSGDKDYSLVAVASKSFGPAAVHGMFGYTWIGKKKDSNLQDIPLYGIAVDCGVTEPFHLLAEVSGNRHPDRNSADHPLTALIGATYKVSDNLTLDAGYRKGLNDTVPEWSTTVGASITF